LPCARTILGVAALGDEDRSRELPQRERGATRVTPAPAAQPVLSEELRQRIRAAVRAERRDAVGQDQELASEPERRATASGPRRTDTASPVTNSAERAIESERTAAPIKSTDAAEPVELVKREPATKPEPTDIARANQKPVAVLRADRPERPRAGEPKQPVRRRLITVGMVASALAVIAAVSLAFAVTRYVTSSPANIHTSSATALERQEAAVRKQAATWVAQQVSRGVIVSCDRVMCAALAADGFLSRELLVLGSTSGYPRTSTVVVETAAVRDLFGTSLNTYAPAVLATFGSGDSQITIRVIAPNGATVYYGALGADLAGRKASEAELLQVNVFTLSPTARKQLIAGQVDSRLVLAIAALASKEPVDIVQFGNIGPGADADIPLRYADLAQNDQAAHLAGSVYVQSMRADLGKGPVAYRPAGTATVVLPGGQPVLRIEFTAPSPLGLFSPQGSH
jgi:hypothetical protein